MTLNKQGKLIAKIFVSIILMLYVFNSNMFSNISYSNEIKQDTFFNDTICCLKLPNFYSPNCDNVICFEMKSDCNFSSFRIALLDNSLNCLLNFQSNSLDINNINKEISNRFENNSSIISGEYLIIVKYNVVNVKKDYTQMNKLVISI